VFERIRIRKKETFDSSATPKPGQVKVVPKVLAKGDLDRLKVKMAETIERQKANDPGELKKQIADLKRQVAAKDGGLVTGQAAKNVMELQLQIERLKAAPKRIEVPVIRDQDVDRATRLAERCDLLAKKLVPLVETLRANVKDIVIGIAKAREQPPAAAPEPRRLPPAARVAPAPGHRDAGGTVR
jgi:hypothetical protein